MSTHRAEAEVEVARSGSHRGESCDVMMLTDGGNHWSSWFPSGVQMTNSNRCSTQWVVDKNADGVWSCNIVDSL